MAAIYACRNAEGGAHRLYADSIRESDHAGLSLYEHGQSAALLSEIGAGSLVIAVECEVDGCRIGADASEYVPVVTAYSERPAERFYNNPDWTVDTEFVLQQGELSPEMIKIIPALGVII